MVFVFGCFMPLFYFSEVSVENDFFVTEFSSEGSLDLSSVAGSFSSFVELSSEAFIVIPLRPLAITRSVKLLAIIPAPFG